MRLGYLHVVTVKSAHDHHPSLRKLFGGTYVIGGRLSQQQAEAALETGRADAVAFGTPFLANPDLPERFRRGLPLSAADRKTYYSQGPQGYIDYPEAAAE
jgi:N-ethylmaleimide reductase